jgi:DNA-binding CsgD family transcriptional regulator
VTAVRSDIRVPVVDPLLSHGSWPAAVGAVGSSAGGTPVLLGRDEERATLLGALETARNGRGGAVVVRGEAGIGKSALVSDFADQAEDFRVYRIAGVESEMELPYAGLQQLCDPILEHLPDLPDSYRNALETVLGRSIGSPPERFLVGMAVLELMAAVSDRRPLMWVVDDAQWLDRSSTQAIAFVGRRLHNERALLVIAARDGDDDPDLVGIPELRLPGLSTADAGKLFDSVVTGPTDPVVRDRIIAETHGNPLALLELPRAWTTAELVEGLAGSDGVSLRGHLELAFAKRVSALPLDTKILLTLAAAEPKGDPALLWAAAERLGLDWNAAAPAECAGLIELGRHVWFRHPLVRAAAYRDAPIRKRLEVHRALAEVTDPIRDPDRRAWHRASSTVSPNEDIAIELEHAAGRAKARGGLLAAAAFLERAAFLTPEPARRANRTLAAAKAKRDAGALEPALRLLSAVESEPPSELRNALAQQLRGRIAFDQRRGADAAAFLLSAARRLEPFDTKLARDAHLEALAAAIWASDPERDDLIREAARAARVALSDHESRRTPDLMLEALALRITAGYEAATPALTRALAAVNDPELSAHDAETIGWIDGSRVAGIVALEAWDFDSAFSIAQRQAAAARESGALVQLQFVLNFEANNVVLTGDLVKASALIEEERRLSIMTGVPPLAYSSLLVEAFRGDAARTLPMIALTIDAAIKDGLGRTVGYAQCANAILCNALGRHGEALRCAQAVVAGDVLAFQTLAAPELAEAASRTGDRASLSEINRWMRVRAVATPTEWALGIAALVEALAAGDSDAEVFYQESIAHLGKTPLEIAVARSHLLYGEWLRRQGRKGDAREELETAYEAFRDMGVGAFAERARRELSATSGRRTRRDFEASTELTSQELEIAQLVQLGLSNREIGSRIFLSPRTVEWHLRNIFGKLGVTARRELRDKNFDS